LTRITVFQDSEFAYSGLTIPKQVSLNQCALSRPQRYFRYGKSMPVSPERALDRARLFVFKQPPCFPVELGHLAERIVGQALARDLDAALDTQVRLIRRSQITKPLE
jgi:hypothetical protein